MNDTVCGCIVNSDVIFWFAEGDLVGEIVKLRQKRTTWFWYRDVLMQAQKRGLVRITGHSDDKPFWWRTFDESVEVISEKLKKAIEEGDGK